MWIKCLLNIPYTTLDFRHLNKKTNVGTRKKAVYPHTHLKFVCKNIQLMGTMCNYTVFLAKIRQNEQTNKQIRKRSRETVTCMRGWMNVDVVHRPKTYIYFFHLMNPSCNEQNSESHRPNWFSFFMRMMHNTPMSCVIYYSFWESFN